jgi:hypothetical protein
MNIVSSYKPNPRFQMPTLGQEDALKSSGLLVLAAERFRDEARAALMTVPATRDSFERSQVLTAACKATERAAARDYEATGFPVEILEFTPVETMDRYAPHLPAALEYVTAEYRAALGTVGYGGLVDASILDAARKAIQHEIEAAQRPAAKD